MSATTEPRSASASREPTHWSVPGFEDDLVDAVVLKKANLDEVLLRQGLLDGRVAVRVNSLRALSLKKPLDAAVVDLVLVLLKDSSPSVRTEAVLALQGALPFERVVPALIAATMLDQKLVAPVTELVAAIGAAAVGPLLQGLRCDPETADKYFLPHLMAIGEAAARAMAAALAHPDPRLRANALAGLMLMGVSALEPAHRLVVALGRDGDPAVRSLARQALTQISRSSSPAFAEVRPLPLNDFADVLADEADLKKATKQLESTALLALARDGRGLVRANAWRSLACGGALSGEAALLAGVAVRDSEPTVRREAALALRQVDEASFAHVLPQLLLASRDQDKAVAQAVRQAILSQGKKAVPHLIGQFSARQADLAAAALQSVLLFEGDAVAQLQQALTAGHPLTREFALAALQDLGGAAVDVVLDRLVDLCNDGFDGVRLRAVRALAALTPKAVKANRERLLALANSRANNDASLAVRNAASAWAAALASSRD